MDGTTNRVNRVPTNMPPTSTSPMELRAAAPAPETRVRGKCPAMVAAVVMRMGRRRMVAASRTASSLASPWICSWLANCTMRMPFLATSPTRVTSPTWE